ncbi:response regulator [Colwellia sp. 12G3]|uniref:response regulator n=1 Tax=Colwellia sp. 12G3 TaxID=2058299 RepID=UPI000C32BE8B|nr:response regulator [Colwellia sp. 12G3]PKI15849.1 response regulator [Colwellia sp. 12G3]
MPINVVYIDDEEVLCQLFKEYLHSDEINITVFTDEGPAIEYCNNTKPDMIFIDYRLKKQTGVDVAKAITCISKKILITGELDVTLDKCFEDKIEKPFRLAEIKEYIIKNN